MRNLISSAPHIKSEHIVQGSAKLVLYSKRIIEENNITEFRNLVSFVRDNESLLLEFITKNTYFFSKYLDSKRHLGNKNDRYTHRQVV